MKQRDLSLSFLKTTGLIPVRVRPKQKDPYPDWDPRQAATADKELLLKYLVDNPEANIGALFAGRYVDLDIDNDNKDLEEALAYFLPRTPYVWGRKSKPRSHRVFSLNLDFERAEYARILRTIKNLTPDKVGKNSFSLELRGGKPETGLFSVLPGSIHPSGEEYQWDEATDPTVGAPFISIHSLMRSLRLAVCAAIISQYWVEGVRNDLSLALAGMLWRIRNTTMASYGFQHDDEVPEGIFVISEDDAIAIFKCIMLIAGDDTDDERSRLLNLANTWRKLSRDDGAKATGGKVLAELIGQPYGEKVVGVLYNLLSDTEGAEELEKLAEKFVLWYGTGNLIDLDLVKKSRSKPWMTKTQAGDSMGGMKIRVGESFVKIVGIMYGSNLLQKVYGLTFDPSTEDQVVETDEGPMVNQWRGFATVPSEQAVTDDQVKPFLDYIREVIATDDNGNHDPIAESWVLNWLADIIQNPSTKPGTALVLLGAQGSGKTFLGERILGPIIGRHHYLQVDDVSRITNKFNIITDNKLFVQCDEAVHSYQKDVASRLKAVITDSHTVMEPKGVDPIMKPNLMRLLFTSNEDTSAIFIDPSPHERRFTVLKVSPKKANNVPYWDHMHEWAASNLPLVMRWLMDREYDRKTLMRPVTTKAKQDIQKVGVEPEVSWILTRIHEGFPISEKVHQHWFNCYNEDALSPEDKLNDTLRRDEWPTHVQLTSLEDDFKSFIRQKGRSVYSGSVMTSIRSVFPNGSLRSGKQLNVKFYDSKADRKIFSRVRVMEFPTAEEIIAHLKKKYGAVIEDVVYEIQEDTGEIPDYLKGGKF